MMELGYLFIGLGSAVFIMCIVYLWAVSRDNRK